MEQIKIRGARTHNLKNINLDLPRNQLTVIAGLSERKGNLGTQLSGGEQQMLAFDGAPVLNPKLRLDKPPDGLAPIIVVELLRAIRRMARDEGLPSIVAEQHPRLVLGLTADAVVLDRGTITYRATGAAGRPARRCHIVLKCIEC